MTEIESKNRSLRDPFPEFSDAKGHILQAQKEILLAIRSVLDVAIDKTENFNRGQKKRTIKKVDIK